MAFFKNVKSMGLIVRMAASFGVLSLTAGCSVAQEVAIIQPGAPGQPVKSLSAEEAATIANNSYSTDDVRFMQDMIPHHQQAVDMSVLVEERTNSETVTDIADRIMASQADEIEFMRTWLGERGESAPQAHDHAHGTHISHEMMGMATPEQMAELAASEGVAFDELFLTLMITHHDGALTMVEDLLDQPGSAYDPVLFEFVSDIENDQSAEIERMNDLLATLSPDPRAGLAAGFRDAGEAISNLVKIASLPKPPGFFDPGNPSGLPPIIADDPEEDDAEAAADDGAMDHDAHNHGDHQMDMPSAVSDPMEDATETEDDQSNDETEWGDRSPLLSFSNTDMAFSGELLVVGNYHGFNIYTLSDAPEPTLISSVVCPGGQGDVSIFGDLLIMSVEQTRGRVDCGREGVTGDVSEERFRGLRIFDISDPRRPLQVGQVQTCRGSHTHSIVSGPDADGKIVVYNSGTASIREEDELEGCVGPVPGDDRTALFRIDVIEIPVDDPSAARIVDSPTVFADPESGQIAGLWQGGDHGDDTQRSRQTDHCHDITVFPEKQLAAGACSGNGVIFDISDPYSPQRLDAVTDEKFAYWHSATFNNDGTKVVFTDEWGGGSRPRCRPSDPMDWGANAIFDIVDGQLEFRSYFKIPAPQSEQENCVAHNGSIVPVPGRDLFVQSWYQGGLTVMDFTDSSNVFEIGYFDRGPIHEERLVLGGYWSSYWYDGRIYGTEIVRGLDVFELRASDFMSENEIAAAARADQGALFNPQQQFAVTWPTGDTSVALSYLDQLARANGLPDSDMDALRRAIEAAEDADASSDTSELSAELAVLASRLDASASMQIAGLRQSLGEMSSRLR
ncbi:MAG: DUF305 domain-containing protein [Pseudomonadota bacterium]